MPGIDSLAQRDDSLDRRAAVNAKENGAAFIEAGGVQLLADIIAGEHKKTHYNFIFPGCLVSS